MAGRHMACDFTEDCRSGTGSWNIVKTAAALAAAELLSSIWVAYSRINITGHTHHTATRHMATLLKNILACPLSTFRSYRKCLDYVKEANKKRFRKWRPGRQAELVGVAQAEWEAPWKRIYKMIGTARRLDAVINAEGLRTKY